MPRVARQQSSVDLYHISVRGINQVQLFYDDEDREEFLRRVWQYRDSSNVKVLSWCLMASHVHFLMEAKVKDASMFMKRLQQSYSHYYNAKYDRTGYLFQGRYYSVPIESEGQLLTVIRYIHRNPLEVGESVSSWTSYDDILGASGYTNSIELLQLIDSNPSRAERSFTRLVLEDNRSESGKVGPRRHVADEDAAQIIMKVAGTQTCQAVCDLSKADRKEALKQMKAAGLTVRQISRLTGLNRGVVQRAGAEEDATPRHLRH